jgi:hypothetical protein
MVPSSQVVQSFYSPLWHLATIGAIRTWRAHRETAFRTEWERHVSLVLPEFQLIAHLLRTEFGFDAPISNELLSDWHNRDARELPSVESDMDLVVSLSAFGRRISAATEEDRTALLDSATRRELAIVLEAALVALWCAKRSAHQTSRSALDGVLRSATRIGGMQHSPVIVRDTARDWIHENPWTTVAYSDEVKVMLSSAMDELGSVE